MKIKRKQYRKMRLELNDLRLKLGERNSELREVLFGCADKKRIAELKEKYSLLKSSCSPVNLFEACEPARFGACGYFEIDGKRFETTNTDIRPTL